MPIDLGLQRISRLLSLLGDPHRYANFVHVAGTNGKGSVCSYLASLILANTKGFKVGKFTSPHLIYRHDCVMVNEVPVDREKFEKVEREVLDIDHMHGVGATEFEVLTTVALQIFRLEQVDLAVMEVGLGGRLDATNVLEPARLGKDGTTLFSKGVLCTGITKIGLDHESILGTTIGQIAGEKAGIIKRGITNLVDGTNEQEALDVVFRKANEMNAYSYVVHQDSETIQTQFGDVERQLSPLRGEYQLQNLSLSLKILDVIFPFLQENYPFQSNFTLDNIRRGISQVYWPGRLQHIELKYAAKKDAIPVLLDGAHNGQAAIELAKYLKEKFDDSPRTFVLAVTKGKDLKPLLSQLVGPNDKVIVTRFGAVDGMPWISANDPVDLQRELLKYTSNVIIENEIPKAFNHINQGENVVVCGSLYLVGEVLKLHSSNTN